MDLLKKLKSFWTNLNLFIKLAILLILLGMIVVSFDLGGYAIAALIILVSLFGLYGGIKNKKTAQIIVSLIFVVSMFGSLVSDIQKEKENKIRAQEFAEFEAKKELEEKKKVENNKQSEVPINETANLPVEENMNTKILKSISNDEKAKVLSVNYSDLGEDKVVVIKMNLTGNFSSSDMLKSGFINAKTIIKSVDSNYKSDITKYDFWFVGNVTDSSGNTDVQKLLSFDYSRSTLNNIDLSTTTLDDFIRQAENTWVHPAFNN